MLRVRMSIYETHTDNVLTRADEPLSDDPETADRAISQTLREANEKRDREHISSGKLSASMLGKPLQDQILKSIGVPQKQVDDYILRKFIRGIHCVEWVL